MTLALATLATGCAYDYGRRPGAPQASTPPAGAAVPAPRAGQRTDAGQRAAAVARSMIGIPYRYGGSRPEEGFDCSGLVFYSYTQAGVSVPRTSQALYRTSRKISLAQAAAGDLMFFQDEAKLSHVGIYLGAGRFVHAPSSGQVVKIARIDAPYYQRHLVGVGRLAAD